MTASISLNHLGFAWPEGAPVFDGIDGAVTGVTALVGDNGSGKTTMLRLIAGELTPTSGAVDVRGEVAYLPQDLPIRTESTVAELLDIADRLDALRAIEAGSVDEAHFATVGDDWTVAERARAELDRLGLEHVDLDRTVGSLSGGESMMVGLAGRLLLSPSVLLLDEPTNNLDRSARARLYTAVEEFAGTVLVVSHDRELLRRVGTVAELRDRQLRVFHGNLDVYLEAIGAEQEAARRAVKTAKADMNKQKQELIDVQVVLARRKRYGQKMFETNREPRIVMRARKRAAEVSAAKLKIGHQEDLREARERLDDAEERVRGDASIRIDLPDTEIPAGRDVLKLSGVNARGLFADGVDLHVRGPERVALVGDNGSGKTTLLRIIAGELDADSGVSTVAVPFQYLSQRLDHLDETATVYENVRRLAPTRPDALLRNRLARLGLRTSRTGRPGEFRSTHAGQPVAELSGGERLRTALAGALSAEPAPQLLMLDEPTNNLDMLSVTQLEQALQAYRGALIVASHDLDFLRELGIDRWFHVERGVGVVEIAEPSDME